MENRMFRVKKYLWLIFLLAVILGPGFSLGTDSNTLTVSTSVTGKERFDNNGDTGSAGKNNGDFRRNAFIPPIHGRDPIYL